MQVTTNSIANAKQRWSSCNLDTSPSLVPPPPASVHNPLITDLEALLVESIASISRKKLSTASAVEVLHLQQHHYQEETLSHGKKTKMTSF